MLDWLCYQFVLWFPVWKLDPSGYVYGKIILPRAGNWLFRDQLSPEPNDKEA